MDPHRAVPRQSGLVVARRPIHILPQAGANVLRGLGSKSNIREKTMRHFSRGTCILLMSPLFVATVSAQNVPGRPSAGIPRALVTIVPPGHQLQSPRTFVVGTSGGVQFVASKHIDGRRDVYTSEYGFDLTMMSKPQILVQRQIPVYQAKVAKDATDNFNARSEDVGKADPIVGYDKPQMTKYPWGTGITQRVLHKYMGGGAGKDEIEYSGSYFGMIVSGNVFKLIKLSVSGVDSREAADKWANGAAAAVAKLTLGDLQVK